MTPKTAPPIAAPGLLSYDCGMSNGEIGRWIRDARKARSWNQTQVAVVEDIENHQSLLDEVDLLRDIQVGLADVETGRVIAHEEVRGLLHKHCLG